MSEKQNAYQKLMAKKLAARSLGTLSNADLARKFRPGEKAQPILRRGGRNGSGKP